MCGETIGVTLTLSWSSAVGAWKDIPLSHLGEFTPLEDVAVIARLALFGDHIAIGIILE